MKADLFYTHTKPENIIPLTFVTQQQWEQAERFDEIERNILSSNQFQGKLGDVALVPLLNGQEPRAFIGTGEGDESTAMAHAATLLPEGCYLPVAHACDVSFLMWGLAQYRYDQFKKNDIKPRRLCLDKEKATALINEVSAIFLVRDLINAPTNAMGPKELSVAVSELAKNHGADFEQWVGKELLDANFPAIHTVGRASAQAPRLLSLTWGNPTHPKVTLIGKGVCFDSGGLDIKPSSGMRLMKKDMGGAANVIGLAKLIMDKKIPIRLQVLIPAVENSVGPDAFRPGDIITMRNGLTVEIDNTDAEGRLVLADALVKAGEEIPELIIDFATLTGAARVAVGTEIAAMFTNDDALSQALTMSSEQQNDPVWRLPLFSGYNSMFDSSVADMANSTSSSYAGAITAALFLQRFVTPNNTPWVHFDIMAWNVSNKPGKPEGGEAMGIRAVAHYLQDKYQTKCNEKGIR